MNKTNKDSFVILRVTSELRKSINKKAKELEMSVSTLVRKIIESNI